MWGWVVRVLKEQHPVIRQLEAAVMDRILQESEPVPATPLLTST